MPQPAAELAARAAGLGVAQFSRRPSRAGRAQPASRARSELPRHRVATGGRRHLRVVCALLGRVASTARDCTRGARRGDVVPRLAPSRQRTGGRPRCDPRVAAPRRLGVGRLLVGRGAAPSGHRRRGGARAAGAVRMVRGPAPRVRYERRPARCGCRHDGDPGARAPIMWSACSATATSVAAGSRSSSSASARCCRVDPPPSPCAPARRCCRSPSTSAVTIISVMCRLLSPPCARVGSVTTWRRVTQLIAHELELLIRKAPEQWHLLQPNWPSDPGWHQRGKANAG